MKSKYQKKKEAEERQEEYDSLTLEERLKRLDKRGCTAKKERAKIKMQIKERNKK